MSKMKHTKIEKRDGRPNNVFQVCGYHTCCCKVQAAYIFKKKTLQVSAIG